MVERGDGKGHVKHGPDPKRHSSVLGVLGIPLVEIWDISCTDIPVHHSADYANTNKSLDTLPYLRYFTNKLRTFFEYRQSLGEDDAQSERILATIDESALPVIRSPTPPRSGSCTGQ